MIWALVLLGCIVCIQGQEYRPPAYQHLRPDYRPPTRLDYYRPPRADLYRTPLDETPKPYSFQYDAPAIGGSSARSETADGSGRVTGSYILTDEDGRHRVVEYSADENGFVANVQTNEPGTKSESPANVIFNSAAPPPTYDVAPSLSRPTGVVGYRPPQQVRHPAELRHPNVLPHSPYAGYSPYYS